MEILLFFAFLAGMVTVLSPCVLPVLPALLSAGAGQGHLRPIGIIVGLICSFTFFTLMLTSIVHLTGISPDFLRYIAIVVIAGFGVLMMFPSLGERFAKATAGIADLGQSVQQQSTYFGSIVVLHHYPQVSYAQYAKIMMLSTNDLHYFMLKIQ